jgi:DinB family protein
MLTIDVHEERRDLGASVRGLAALLEGLGEGKTTGVPSISAWSVAEHLYHVCLATDLALRNVASLVSGRGRHITSEGAPNDLALQVLTEGCYPRGESQAPRMVQPPSSVDLELLDQEVELLGQGLSRTDAILEQVADAPNRIPHQHLGQLNAAQWLRFARLHARHHLAIATDVARSLS